MIEKSEVRIEVFELPHYRLLVHARRVAWASGLGGGRSHDRRREQVTSKASRPSGFGNDKCYTLHADPMRCSICQPDFATALQLNRMLGGKTDGKDRCGQRFLEPATLFKREVVTEILQFYANVG